MSSHAELLSHSCFHCADRDEFFAPVDLDVDLGQGARRDCLWFKLAHAWLDKPFKNTLGLIEYSDSSHSVLQRDGLGYTSANGRLHVFEWMVPSQDDSEVLYSLDKKRRLTTFSGGTSSAATFEILKKWIAVCESSHEICRTKDQNDQHLKGIRFLCIRSDRVFLEEGVVPGRYACLSHCWGTIQNLLKTTQENKGLHMHDGVSIQDLPKTYQDTVTVCKELGINHLWIDSLCIVQNSNQDWNEQASQMADVYQNAYITIAAVAARDSSEGLFNDTSHRLTSVPLPGYPWIHIRRQTQLPSQGDEFMDLNSKDGHALYKRGWTFQELSLSPRVIHYGRNEVIWSCQSRSSCECDPEGMMDVSHLVSVNLTRDKEISAQNLWHVIVESYSWRSLTFDKDRLPAIAAFASRMQAQGRKNRYIHGLWEDSLRLDLLWFADEWKPDQHSSGSSFRLGPRRLPTWSWTSVAAKTSVMWAGNSVLDECEEIPHTKIMKVAYETRGPTLLGDAIEAHIIIQAPIFRLCDIRLVKRGDQSDRDELVWHAPSWDTLSDAAKYGKQSTEALAIPLVMTKRRCIGGYNSRPMNALLIVESSEVGKYARVGVTTLGPRSCVTHSDEDWESSEGEKAEKAVEQEKGYESFMQIMEQMEKRTITLI